MNEKVNSQSSINTVIANNTDSIVSNRGVVDLSAYQLVELETRLEMAQCRNVMCAETDWNGHCLRHDYGPWYEC